MATGLAVAALLAVLPLPVAAAPSPEVCSNATQQFAPPVVRVLPPPAGGGTVGGIIRVFAMHHKQCLGDAVSYASIYSAFDHELSLEVDPYRASGRPNLVVYNELTGLVLGTEGSRGANARNNADQLIAADQQSGQEGAAALLAVAANYGSEFSYYQAKFAESPPSGYPDEISRLFTAITDTVVRSVLENGSRLAKAHHVYVVIGAPLPVQEHAGCTGAYAGWVACPGWHDSTNPADRCALGDPDLAASPCLVPSVYVADVPTIDNVELVFAPDGTLYDMQPKVNLTAAEESPFGWHEASPSTIHAIPLYGADRAALPQVKLGIGISLDAFEHSIGANPCPPDNSVNDATGVDDYPQFMQCLDSKGVNVFLQPEFNSASQACMSWTDFSEGGCSPGSWQPVGWMHSSWCAVQCRNPDGSFLHPNFLYAVNPFLIGNLFDIAGDGQTAIFARNDSRAVTGSYAGDSSASLYADPALGYVSHADAAYLAPFEGPKPGFLAVTPWTMTDSNPNALYRTKANQVAGTEDSLQACEKGLAPGSGVTSGPCAENAELPSVIVADLVIPASPGSASLATPNTSRAGASNIAAWAFLAGGLLAALGAAVWRRPAVTAPRG